ncbi:MAG: ABC transporter permease [Spirochaetaceae bacterium]|jgi:ribose transport system permease protein|nr:ABC transporter permease [Spirochaetaceae bacterium]
MAGIQSLRFSLSRSQQQILSALIGLIALSLIFTIFTPFFFNVDNLLTVAQQTTVIAIIALGQTYVLITGGIDLSIGSNIALAAMVAAMMMVHDPDVGIHPDLPMLVGLLMGLLTGVAAGAASGAMIAFGNIPPFIATLGTMTVVRGLALCMTQGYPISALPDSFTAMGTGYNFGLGNIYDINMGGYYVPEGTIKIPNIVMIMIFTVFVFGFILQKTKWGRHVYAVGSNFEAARLSGVNTKKTIMMVYIFSGFLAALAGCLLAARIYSAGPAAGDGYELDAVASSVIGGTSTMGGEGTAIGTFLGAFIIGVLRNGLNLIGVNPFVQKIVIGLVIVGSVFVDRIRNRT